ncbi:MAG TPA: tRNA (adenosine(37)-N6)-threonylcarbamoyltransferase complex dimerization subunit type 1 TsaB [Dongiaceae bacterium]|nr:tRNA (adenosine(37)-N6)-threonylcarbamoyltransferase complex dimerization subunit type 1 TsaB [Dongiaceae bacterium]
MSFSRNAPLLAIDTAGAACSVALWAEGTVLAHEIAATQHGHAVALAPMLDRLAAATGIDFKALGAVAVSCGPGGFTGMRVGLATARALALAIGCPSIGIGSFQALAATAMRSGGHRGTSVLAVLDSRRDELFAAELDVTLATVGAPMLLLPEAIGAYCRDRSLPLIADAELTQFAAPDFAGLTMLHANADALTVAELAATRPDLHLPTEPIYVRPPDVSQPKASVP